MIKAINSPYFQEFGVLEESRKTYLREERKVTTAFTLALGAIALVSKLDIENLDFKKKSFLCLTGIMLFGWGGTLIYKKLSKRSHPVKFQKFDPPHIQRPKEVEQKIDAAFSEMVKRASDSYKSKIWDYTGEKGQYGLMNLNECKLVEKIITEAPTYQKEFTVIDIGCGEGMFGDYLSSLLNQQKILCPDKKIHIISMTGETFKYSSPLGEDQEIDLGQIKISKLCHFKIENLRLELKKRNLSLENKVDLIVSRWTFAHLVDPLGTLIQALHLLRPESGLLLMDTFYFLTDKSNVRIFNNLKGKVERTSSNVEEWIFPSMALSYLEETKTMNLEEEAGFWKVQGLTGLRVEISNENLVSFLIKTGAPFLIQGSWFSLKVDDKILGRLRYEFIMKKPSSMEFCSGMRYSGMLTGWRVNGNHSSTILEFQTPPEKEKKTPLNLPKPGGSDRSYYGDRNLFDLLDKTYEVTPLSNRDNWKEIFETNDMD